MYSFNMDFEQYKKRVGLKIKYYRKLKDLTQVVFSEKLGCTENYVSLIENGRKNISLKMIYKICGVLEISASKIFDIED